MEKTKRGGFILCGLVFGAGWVAGGGNIVLGVILVPVSFLAVGWALTEKK